MVKTSKVKKYRFMFLMLLLTCDILINACYSQTKINTEVRSKEFGYINFKRTHITLPDMVLNIPLRDISTEKAFIQGMFFDKKQKFEPISDSLEHGIFAQNKIEWVGKQEIPRNFVDLLCDNGMVNIARDYGLEYWETMFYIEGDTIIKNFKEWNEFWFLGKISINPNYDSYLIFIHEKDTSVFFLMRSLFLMNVKDDKITSLAQVAYKLIIEGDGPCQFTKASSRKRYCYYSETYHDVAITNWFGKINIPKKMKLTYYALDENGYVEVRELKGRKKFIINKFKHILFENIR